MPCSGREGAAGGTGDRRMERTWAAVWRKVGFERALPGAPFDREIRLSNFLPCWGWRRDCLASPYLRGLDPPNGHEAVTRRLGKIRCGPSIDPDRCANGTIFAIAKLSCEIG